MHIDRIPNRNSPPAYLLREGYREDGKVKKRTLANITHWPAGKIEALRRLLRDEYAPHEPRADLKLNRCTDDGLPVHSFRSLLADLATVTRNVMAMDGAPEASFVLYPQLTPVQGRAFQLLDLGVKV